MKLSFALLLGLMGSLLPAAPASAQLAGYALYDVGAATTELGSDKGRSKLVYGMGAGASYGVLSMGDLRFVVGADLLVRGFGLEVPARVDLDTGVFDQSDVWLDQYVAFRFRSVMAGVYFEQRSIDRGRAGTIGLPASGVGLLAEISWGERVTARISYAGFPRGRLRVDGAPLEPDVTSGRSVRVSLTYRLTDQWSARGAYASTTMEIEPVPPTFSFFDHRQSLVTSGVVLAF